MMKNIKKSPKKSPKKSQLNSKNCTNRFQDQQMSESKSQASIQFSVSFPSQTRRSQSPGIKSKRRSDECACEEMKRTIETLKAENKMLASENEVLKQELIRFKKQNLEALDLRSIIAKKFQTKSIECQQLKSKIKELSQKIDSLSRPNTVVSMCSLKHLEDKEDTMATICLEKQRQCVEEDLEIVFNKKVETQLAKYVDIKMKLDLTLRKLEQKQMMISFLQNAGRQQQ